MLFICPRIPHTPYLCVSHAPFSLPSPNLILLRSMKPFRESSPYSFSSSSSCSTTHRRLPFNIAVLSSIFHRRSPTLGSLLAGSTASSRQEGRRASASISPSLIFNPLKEKITIKIQILTISAPLFDAMQRGCFPLSSREHVHHCTAHREGYSKHEMLPKRVKKTKPGWPWLWNNKQSTRAALEIVNDCHSTTSDEKSWAPEESTRRVLCHEVLAAPGVNEKQIRN